MRYVIEGEWSGYQESQRRVCHRTVIRSNKKDGGIYVRRIKEIGWIQFTDGTSLNLSIRPCTPRERVLEIRGYVSLINDAVYSDKPGSLSVLDLGRRRAG